METKDYVTLTVACIGAVTGLVGMGLGIFNTWKAHNKDKVKLKMTVGWAMDKYSSVPYFNIQVINLSSFPITISSVGVELPNQQLIDTSLMQSRNQQSAIPTILAPRTSKNFYHSPAFHLAEEFMAAENAFVSTACGTTVRQAVKGIQEDIKAGRG